MAGEGLVYVPNELLGRLVGCRLYSVQFVHDYAQLRFDGLGQDTPVLNCYVMPVVDRDGTTIADGDVGYADALRTLIPKVVKETHEGNAVGLRIEFDDEVIVLHPSLDEVPGPEIALLSGFEDGRWMCWRPGEESFEDIA